MCKIAENPENIYVEWGVIAPCRIIEAPQATVGSGVIPCLKAIFIYIVTVIAKEEQPYEKRYCEDCKGQKDLPLAFRGEALQFIQGLYLHSRFFQKLPLAVIVSRLSLNNSVAILSHKYHNRSNSYGVT
jgi:hypothetical protein